MESELDEGEILEPNDEYETEFAEIYDEDDFLDPDL